MNDKLNNFYKRFSAGEFVMVYDEYREVEGDFFVLAEAITPEKVNFLLEYGKGLICVACSEEVLDRLEIPLMVKNNEDPHHTNFTVSVDAKEGITTGVSAEDRAKTIKLLSNKKSVREDFLIPGHSFPLRAQKDLTKRFGHTEASVELSKKCGKLPVVVICEILNKQGEKATKKELDEISEKFDIPHVNLEDLREVLG